MNIGLKKLLREVASTFSGAQDVKDETGVQIAECNLLTVRELKYAQHWFCFYILKAAWVTGWEARFLKLITLSSSRTRGHIITRGRRLLAA
jgi:hypothetical protein